MVVLAEQCGYTFDRQDAEIVIAAPFITCGITVKVNYRKVTIHETLKLHFHCLESVQKHVCPNICGELKSVFININDSLRNNFTVKDNAKSM